MAEYQVEAVVSLVGTAAHSATYDEQRKILWVRETQAGTHYLQAYDMSVPLVATPLGKYTDANMTWAGKPEVSGGYVYMSTWDGVSSGALMCINAVNPNNLTLAGATSMSAFWYVEGGLAAKIAVRGNTLYLTGKEDGTTTDHGVTAVNISVPGTFTLIGYTARKNRFYNCAISPSGYLITPNFGVGESGDLWDCTAGGVPLFIRTLDKQTGINCLDFDAHINNDVAVLCGITSGGGYATWFFDMRQALTPVSGSDSGIPAHSGYYLSVSNYLYGRTDDTNGKLWRFAGLSSDPDGQGDTVADHADTGDGVANTIIAPYWVHVNGTGKLAFIDVVEMGYYGGSTTAILEIEEFKFPVYWTEMVEGE